MNALKSILVLTLIVFTFLGNVGVNVFTHSCKEDGVFRSYFVQTQNHCIDHVIESVPPCCEKKVIKDDGCCNDEVEVYKVNFDFFTNYSVEVPFFYVLEASSITTPYLFSSDFHGVEPIDYYRPPPKKNGKQIIIFNRVFRI